MSSEMCFLHLTHPSGAVGSRLCGARGAVGGSVPWSRVSPQLRTLLAGAGIRTHNLGLSRVSSPTLYQLGHDCPLSAMTAPSRGMFKLVMRIRRSYWQKAAWFESDFFVNHRR